jgi:heptosyltransferase-2
MARDFSKLSRILIIRLSSLGDVLLTTPLIRSIKKINPDLMIDFFVREEFSEALQNNPHLNVIYKYTKENPVKQSLFKSITSNKYELIIDLQNNFRSKEITKLFNCEVVRFKKNNVHKFLLVHFKINRLKDSVPIPLRYAEAAGIKELDDGGPEFFTENQPNRKLNGNGTYIGICPGAKHFTKRWPKEFFIDLGKKIESEGYQVVIFGGKDEIQLCLEIENKLNKAINLSNTNLLQIGADMQLCKTIYTNDSGLMHLATAVKVPVISFFGSTVKEFGFYPYNTRSIVLENEGLSCRPCTHIGRKSCPKIHFKCMNEIKPEVAFTSLKKLLPS